MREAVRLDGTFKQLCILSFKNWQKPTPKATVIRDKIVIHVLFDEVFSDSYWSD